MPEVGTLSSPHHPLQACIQFVGTWVERVLDIDQPLPRAEDDIFRVYLHQADLSLFQSALFDCAKHHIDL